LYPRSNTINKSTQVSNIASYGWSIKDNYKYINDPPKLFLITKIGECCSHRFATRPPRAMNGWQNGKSKKMEVKNFSIIVLAQRMVKKKGEEGFYLYLKRQSEGTWMNSKCQIHIK
jgi:hypothetical protein